MKNITVYSKKNCGNCEMVKEKLTSKGIKFEASYDEDELMALASDYCIMSAPIVKIEDDEAEEKIKVLPGVDALKELGCI